MQNTGDALLAAAVESGDRFLVYKFEVDWNRNGLYNHALSDLTTVVTSLTVNRDINGSLPPETTIIEGFMAAQMNVVLGGTRPGDSSSIAKLLSPWNSAAPLFGDGRLVTPIRASIGHRVSTGAETLVKQFTGVISEFTVDSRSSQVSITCLDRADTLRAAINLPQFALEEATFSARTNDYRTNTQWVIDYVLRRNGYYMSPPPQQGCIYSATMHGSLAPEIGNMAFLNPDEAVGVCNPEDPVYFPGRPGWGLAYGGTHRYVPISHGRAVIGFYPLAGYSISFQAQLDLSKPRWPTASGHWCEYSSGQWPYGSDSTNLAIRNYVTLGGQQQVTFFNGVTTLLTVNGPTLALTGFQDVWCRVDFGSPLSNSTVSFPGMTVTGVNLSGWDTTKEIWAHPSIKVLPIYPTHDFQVCNATGLAAGATIYDVGAWVPQCDLDTGLNDFPGLPIRRGVPSWDLLKEVVGAEFGVVGFNEDGRPFFKNRDTIRRQNLSVEKTLTNDVLISDVALSERTGSVRNRVTSKVAPFVIASGSDTDNWSVAFKLTDRDAIVCPPGQSIHQIKLDFPCLIEDSSYCFQETAASWPPNSVDNSTRFAAVLQHDVLTEQAGVTLVQVTLPDSYGLDQLRLVVNNPGIYPIVFANQFGDPALWVTGRKYFEGKETELEVSRASSIARYGERTLELPDSDWVQREKSIGVVARALLKDLKVPVPVVQRLVAVGDCRLQLQDTASMQDTEVLGGPMLTTVTGCSRQLTADPSTGAAKLVDSLNVRPFAAPGKWILGHATWSVLGQTTKL